MELLEILLIETTYRLTDILAVDIFSLSPINN